MTTPKNSYQRVLSVNSDGTSPTIDNPAPVYLADGNATVFGEVLTAPLTPVLQAYTHRFGDSRVWDQFLASGGSITQSTNRCAQLATGTSAGAYSTLLTHTALAYQPGEGAGARYTSAFITGGVADSIQLSGMITAEDALAFGFNGTAFGILHRYSRRLEIQSLQVTGAAGGSENATITLDGVGHTVALTAGTVQHNAREIAEFATGYLDAIGQTINAYQVDDTVWFVTTAVGDKTGAFTFSSGTATGTFTEEQTGATGTQDWTTQANWNIDPMDGTGPSGLTLDTSNMNIYEIQLGWLGVAPITFFVGHPSEPRMVPVHRITWANENAYPHVADPRFPIGYSIASLGSTTNIQLNCASVMGYIQGQFTVLGPRWSKAVDAVAANATESPVLSIKASPVETNDGHISRRRVLVDEIDVTNVGSKDVLIRVYKGDPTNLTAYNFQENDSANESNVWADTAATGLVTTPPLKFIRSMNVPGGTEFDIRFPDPLVVDREEVLIITAETSSASTTVAATVSGKEDV